MKAKLLLAMASLAFALVLGEGILRLYHAAWPFETQRRNLPYLTSKDTTLRWRYSPRDGRNSLGLRNREIRPKGDRVFRILVLGDSLVWSGETSSGKLYTEVIEEALNRTSLAGKSIEVVNAGIPGYTTYQELEFLKLYGLDMEPDLVVLGFVLNDVYFPYLHRPTVKAMLAREPEARLHRLDPARVAGKLLAKCYFAHEMAGAWDRVRCLLGLAPFFTFEHRDDLYLAWKSYGWNSTDSLLGEMAGLLSTRHIPLLLVIFPVRDQVEEEVLAKDRAFVLYPQERIKEICRRHAIGYFDLTGPLQRGGGRLFSDYLHLQREGNDVVGAELANYLARSMETAVGFKSPSR